MKKTIALTIAFLLVINLFSQVDLDADKSDTIAEEDDYFYNILELAPVHGDFALEDKNFDKNAKLYQYSIKEYNAIREDMIGKYDIIYISNGKDKGEKYTTLGEPIDKLPAGGGDNGTIVSNYDALDPMYEYWPGTDFTELTLGYLRDFMNAGHLVFADEEFKKFDESKAIINKFVLDNQSEIIFEKAKEASKEIEKHVKFNKYTSKGIPRPYLKMLSLPSQYDGTEASLIDTSFGSIITFDFAALSYEEETSFDIKLYFDINGDNKFKESDYELLKVRSNVSSNENLSLSFIIPEDFNGLQQWKFEIIDLNTGANAYQTGFMAFRGDQPLEVNVLQIACNGNTFNLGTELIDESGNNLLTSFADDYLIDVDVMTMSEFKDLYTDPNFKLTEYVKPGNTKAYNMLVFGFADIYGGADITEEHIANDLKEFLNTGQSVMFTHDNLTFRVDDNGWSRGLTKYFRDYVGQNIYANGNMPNPGYTTMGVSDMAIERANGDGFETTKEVYASNDGILVNYPFRILNTDEIKDFYDYTYNDRKLKVATTHYQYYQLDLNNEEVVVWYSLTGGGGRNDYHDPGNYYYTYSIGNVTYSGTGHSNLKDANSYDERRLFVNTIIKAIRGANFAPEVIIQGVSDGDNVAKTRSSMEFSILATDPDINDEYLNGTVYLDMNGDGIYSPSEIVNTYSRTDYTGGPNGAVENRVPKDVILDLTKLTSGISEFGFKVVVSDKLGASSTKEFRFPLVSSPDMSIVLDAPGGMLIGDKETITSTIKLTVPADSTETRIKNISVESNLHSSTDIVNEIDMFNTTNYIVNNYSSGYVKSGYHLLANHTDLTGLTTVVEQNVGTYSYDIQGKVQGDYYLNSALDYSLHSYGFSETRTSGKEFKVRKGEIRYSLIDDFGAPVSSTLNAELYYFPVSQVFADENAPDLSLGTKVMDVSISGGAIVLGDDASEILKTGKYALNIVGSSGYSGGLSRISKLNIDAYTDTVEVTVFTQPISDLEWIHENESFNNLGYALLPNNNTSNSIIQFNTFKGFEEFQLGVDPSGASGKMNYSLTKILLDDGVSVTDVTARFSFASNKLTYIDTVDMPTGNYKIYFKHYFYNSVKGGTRVSYELEEDINVKLKDATGAIVSRVYSFSTSILEFMKAIELL